MARGSPYSYEELIAADLVWLLSMDMGGTTHRFATEPIVVSASSSGLPSTIAFPSGLTDFAFLSEAVPFEEGDTSPSVDLDVYFDHQGDSWADFLDDVQSSIYGVGEVSLIRRGDVWEDREVVMAGQVSAMEFGGLQDTIGFSLQFSVSRQDATVPDTSLTVNKATWDKDGTAPPSTYDVNIGGEAYQVVIGYPGTAYSSEWPLTGDAVASITDVGAIPGLYVELDPATRDNQGAFNRATIMFCGYPTQAAESGATVAVQNVTKGISTSGTAKYVRDDYRVILYAGGGLSGGRRDAPAHSGTDTGAPFRHTWREVSVVEIPAASHDFDEGDEIWMRLSKASDAGGVFLDDSRTPVRGVGSVAEWVLLQAGVPLDREGSAGAIAALNAYQLDFMWNSHRTAIEVISEDIAPFFPIGYEAGPSGLRLIHWNLWASHADVTFRVDRSKFGGSRVTNVVTSDSDDIVNQWTLSYYFDGRGDRYLRSMTIGGDGGATSTDEPVYVPNPIAEQSQTLFGTRASEMECPSVQEAQTARAACEYLIRRDALPHQTVQFQLPQQYQSVRNGSIGTITDPEIGWTDKLVMAYNVRRGTRDTQIEFRTLPDPARELRP